MNGAQQQPGDAAAATAAVAAAAAAGAAGAQDAQPADTTAANGGSGAGSAQEAMAAAAINKKRKKDGLKPIITTANPPEQAQEGRQTPFSAKRILTAIFVAGCMRWHQRETFSGRRAGRERAADQSSTTQQQQQQQHQIGNACALLDWKPVEGDSPRTNNPPPLAARWRQEGHNVEDKVSAHFPGLAPFPDAPTLPLSLLSLPPPLPSFFGPKPEGEKRAKRTTLAFAGSFLEREDAATGFWWDRHFSPPYTPPPPPPPYTTHQPAAIAIIHHPPSTIHHHYPPPARSPPAIAAIRKIARESQTTPSNP
ncbi:uncharacterized protein E0L32_001110 [Thyridium curvatum]|uniref:Uncharacterized protein n=1 Tax=Thyridium curvatum TaxID=1093900 RepID=A0A507AN24_9PEZI|nr:uncharacterized protein E0L32_001110 [Thyridium curvatum]TPX11292.1 hypothetical protein E0L32_001110 [Thyridium curvatum]